MFPCAEKTGLFFYLSSIQPFDIFTMTEKFHRYISLSSVCPMFSSVCPYSQLCQPHQCINTVFLLYIYSYIYGGWVQTLCTDCQWLFYRRCGPILEDGWGMGRGKGSSNCTQLLQSGDWTAVGSIFNCVNYGNECCNFH